MDGSSGARWSGTITHAALAMAVGAALSNALRDRACRVLSSDVRVRSKATGLATYPDVTVVCQKIETDADDAHGVLNPTVIVEGLSDSTEGYDCGAKAAHSRRIPSLREYVLVSQHEPLIEGYRRNERGNWELFVEARTGDVAELTSCGPPIGLAVDETYRDPLAARPSPLPAFAAACLRAAPPSQPLAIAATGPSTWRTCVPPSQAD